MKNILWQILFLILGVVILFTSIYQAGVVGALGKMGLIGQESSGLFDIEEVQKVIDNGEIWECEKRFEGFSSLTYYLSDEEGKIDKGWEIGKQRMGCGIREVESGKGISGVYKIIRGARYFERSLLLFAKNKDCNKIPDIGDISKLEKIVELAKGSAKVEIGKIEERVHERYLFEVEGCIDQGTPKN